MDFTQLFSEFIKTIIQQSFQPLLEFKNQWDNNNTLLKVIIKTTDQ